MTVTVCCCVVVTGTQIVLHLPGHIGSLVGGVLLLDGFCHRRHDRIRLLHLTRHVGHDCDRLLLRRGYGHVFVDDLRHLLVRHLLLEAAAAARDVTAAATPLVPHARPRGTRRLKHQRERRHTDDQPFHSVPFFWNL
jgi:hypothetical protein